jgi:hypothetical protein
MPCLWLQHNNSQLFVNVGILDAATINLATMPPFGGVAPNPQMFVALVDTGAQTTMISTNVAATLNLQPQGKIPIPGVGHNITYHNGYLFHVAFTFPLTPIPQTLPAGSTVQVQLAVFILPKAIYGAELTTASGFDVLLGMDVLSTGSLKVEGSGHYSFSF